MPTSALLVEDDPDSLKLLGSWVRLWGMDARMAGTASEARSVLAGPRPDLAIVDLRLPDGDGMELVRQIGHEVPTAVVTGVTCANRKRDVLAAGVAEFLTKPLDMQRLERFVEGVVQKQAAPVPANAVVDTMHFGNSSAMRTLHDRILQVAEAGSHVVVQGEPGTGKLLTASAVHLSGENAHRSLRVVRAREIGRPAPSGAGEGPARWQDIVRRESRAADGGTLCIAGAHELPRGVLAELMSVLEVEFRYGRVRPSRLVLTGAPGAWSTPILRALASFDHRDTVGARLVVPPLRERPEDLPQLMAVLFGGSRDLAEARIDPSAIAHASSHPWPGNVRQLKTAIESTRLVSPHRLDGSVFRRMAPLGDRGAPFAMAPGMNLAEIDRRLFVGTLVQCGFDKRAVADQLGVSLKTVYNRGRQYETDPFLRHLERPDSV